MSPAPTIPIPRITTKRLLLREGRRSDFDAVAEDHADPVARAHQGVVDRRAAWRLFKASAGSWVIDGAGWWVVELLATREPVGMVGAFHREGAAGQVDKGELELGWTVFRRHWGRGFATEAAAAALDFGLHVLGAERAIAHIDADNAASIRVSEHLGMRYEAEVDFYGVRLGRYAIDRGAALRGPTPTRQA